MCAALSKFAANTVPSPRLTRRHGSISVGQMYSLSDPRATNGEDSMALDNSGGISETVYCQISLRLHQSVSDAVFQTLRPQLATFNVTNGLLRGLKVIKPVAWGWNLPGQNIRVENHLVDAKPDNGTRDDTTVSFEGPSRRYCVSQSFLESFPFNT